MPLNDFIRDMPKVELHVHLKGSTAPETLLQLANKHKINLPADTVAGVRSWFQFRDFDHFITVYDLICECFREPDDIELVMRQFLQGQAAQNIRYTEVTYTASRRIPFEHQLVALNRARAWAESELGVRAGIVMDIPMELDRADGLMLADWAISGMGRGVVGFGLGGGEGGAINAKHKAAFDRVRAAGLPSVPHAGETTGPETIWSAIRDLGAVRLGHGVQAIHDPALVDILREREITLEVCPTSNVCLGVFPTLNDHSLPQLVDAGLRVTINTDDPPMFNTSLVEEYQRVAATFNYDVEQIITFVMTALESSFLPAQDKAALHTAFTESFESLKGMHGL